MVFNFRICGISRDARKLIKTLILIKKNKKKRKKHHQSCTLFLPLKQGNPCHEFSPRIFTKYNIMVCGEGDTRKEENRENTPFLLGLYLILALFILSTNRICLQCIPCQNISNWRECGGWCCISNLYDNCKKII